MNAIEIINKYTIGEATLEETNAALAKEGFGFHLDPMKNVITEEEKAATTLGENPAQVNGWGLLDTGTGSFDKVQVVNGVLVGFDNQAGMHCLFLIGGKTYKVDENRLAAY